MCGISGFVNFTSESPSLSLVKRMTEAISYRGPDDFGVEIIENCALGNTRLTVIDLSKKGHMPMWDREKRFCITYNGEIYNFQKVKVDLERRGYHFRSNSDTEVILNLYKEYGEKCVKKLSGMFAFAIWDRKKRELFIARDQFGIKPFHYFINDKVFIFGSEIKAVLIHPEVKKAINPTALSHYFSLGFGCIASPETIFHGIYKLPPGHCALLSDKKLTIKKYWDISDRKMTDISLSEAVLEVRRLLEQDVRMQMVSDVPLGVFLSGGIDSSLMAAIAQKNSNKRVKTFSIGFTDREFDESQYARQAASYLKTDHYHKHFRKKELFDTLPRVIDKLDEPLADASILPTYLLSEFTRRKVTVALSGDGGDELFAGYPTYIAHKMAGYMNFLPKWVLGGVGVLGELGGLGTLPIFKHSPNLSSRYKIGRFINGLDRDLTRQYINFMGPMTLEDKRRLLTHDEEMALPYVKKLMKGVDKFDRQSLLQYLDLKVYLGEDCLVKADRASSYNSLEVRVPFLTPKMAELIFSLPSSYHLHNFTLKYLLKKAAEGYLPEHIINRPKKGFGIPVHIWLRTKLRKELEFLLSGKIIRKQGLFDSNYVNQLVNEHMSGKVDHRMVLWNLFVFEKWYEKWFK
jgi:asparagine synthase (glutamine-hydrolysing)